jgi:tetratricopeptide (TPR) repeat protein
MNRLLRGKTSRQRKVVLALILCGTLLVAAIGGYWWRYRSSGQPPLIDLTNADPAVASIIADARRQVHRAPRSAAAWGKLGMVLAAHDFRAEANTCFAQAERLDARELRWPYFQGITLSQGDPEAALGKLRRAVELSGDQYPECRLRLAEALVAQGRFDEAEEHCRRVLERDPQHLRAYLDLGRLAYERGQLQEALDHLDRTTLRKAALTLRAEIHQRLGDSAAAVQDLRQAAELREDPGWPDALVDEVEQLQVGLQARLARADHLLGQNRLAEAIAWLQQFTDDYPDTAAAWLGLGQAFNRSGDFVAAERALRTAVTRAPASAEAHFALGVALFQQGKSDAAAECFHQATVLKPSYALAHYNLGHCWKLQGKRKDAIESFRAAVRCRPHYAEAHVNLADLLLEDGRADEAVGHLQDALRLTPHEARARKLLEQARQRGDP